MNTSETHKTPGSGTLRSEFAMLGYVWRSARGMHTRIVLPMLAQILLGLFPAVITYQVQSWITGTESVAELLQWRHIVEFVGMILGMTIIRQISSLSQGIAMAEIRRNLERRYIDWLAARDFRPEEHGAGTGRTGHRSMMAFSRESEMLTGLIPMFYRSFVQAPLTIISFMALMVWMSWQLSCVVALLAASVAVSCVLLRKKVKAVRRVLYGRMSDLYQLYSDWVKGGRVLRFYDSDGFVCGKLAEVVHDSCRLNKRLVGIACRQNIATELLTYAGVLAFILVVASGRDAADWGILLAYPLAILYIRSEAIKVVNGYAQLAATESSVRHLVKAFGSTVGKSDHDAIVSRRPVDSFELDHVRFGYREGTDVLSDFSVRFSRGRLNVIAGESGAGKSTCLDLLTKAIEPLDGKVLLDGTDMRLIDGRAITAITALVEQEPYLFEGTLLENLTFGKTADINEILSLCRELHLERVASTEADLQRRVSDSGLNLSSGEKQRIAFIRALLKHPSVLLLDEATSAVDADTSAAMMIAIGRICRTTLTVCVTHDPAVMRIADTLVKISDGKAEIIHNHEGDTHPTG